MCLIGCNASSHMESNINTMVSDYSVYTLALSIFGQFVSALSSHEFWRMQRAMIYTNTQVFGPNRGQIVFE